MTTALSSANANSRTAGKPLTGRRASVRLSCSTFTLQPSDPSSYIAPMKSPRCGRSLGACAVTHGRRLAHERDPAVRRAESHSARTQPPRRVDREIPRAGLSGHRLGQSPHAQAEIAPAAITDRGSRRAAPDFRQVAATGKLAPDFYAPSERGIDRDTVILRRERADLHRNGVTQGACRG